MNLCWIWRVLYVLVWSVELLFIFLLNGGVVGILCGEDEWLEFVLVGEGCIFIMYFVLIWFWGCFLGGLGVFSRFGCGWRGIRWGWGVEGWLVVMVELVFVWVRVLLVWICVVFWMVKFLVGVGFWGLELVGWFFGVVGVGE